VADGKRVNYIISVFIWRAKGKPQETALQFNEPS
jgi:hypothetical protein